MKQFLLLTALLIVTGSGLSAQTPMEVSVTFENDVFDHQELIAIDSTDSTNCWQIAIQQKFLPANPVSHVIITDSVNAYPSSDTSSFIYSTYDHSISPTQYPIMHFNYRIDADSADHGMLEVSIDNGQSWLDALDPTLIPGLYVTNMSIPWQADQNDYNSTSELFTGSQTGWLYCEMSFQGIDLMQGLYDTILYRFTFVSDSINTGQDGWMLDILDAYDYLTVVPEINGNSGLLSVQPNPAAENVMINTHDRSGTIQLMTVDGKEVFSTSTQGNAVIDMSAYDHGTYLLIFESDDGVRDVVRVIH